MSNEPERDDAERPSAVPFGPGFFLGQLRVFARDACPSPSEGLPSVTVRLATGEVLELCHVIGLAPSFVALAIHDDPDRGQGGPGAMRTELVPYGIITQVTIRSRRGDPGTRVGFDASREPRAVVEAISPEEALRAVSRAPPSGVTSRGSSEQERG